MQARDQHPREFFDQGAHMAVDYLTARGEHELAREVARHAINCQMGTGKSYQGHHVREIIVFKPLGI